MTKERKIRVGVFIVFLVIIVALHLMPKPENTNIISVFYNYYLIDILLPCYLVIMLTLSLDRLPEKLLGRRNLITIFIALFVFLIGFTVETLQYFDLQILGTTFDPFDYLMYLFGVVLGLSVDRGIIIISKNF